METQGVYLPCPAKLLGSGQVQSHARRWDPEEAVQEPEPQGSQASESRLQRDLGEGHAGFCQRKTAPLGLIPGP